MLKQGIKKEITDSGKTITDIAKKCGFSREFLSLLINGHQTFTDEMAMKILTKGFGYSREEATNKIAGWKIEEYAEEMAADELDKLMYKLGATQLNLGEDFINIPVYGSISCGPAGGTDVIDTMIVQNTDLDPRKEYYALRANGESMSPEIPHGAKVVIEKTREYQGPSYIYVFKVGSDQLGLGRITKFEDHWEITKSNKSFGPVPVKGEYGLEVCGKVALVIFKP